MTTQKTQHGAIVVTALVSCWGARWLESATYYGYTVRDAKASFRESCKRLGYELV